MVSLFFLPIVALIIFAIVFLTKKITSKGFRYFFLGYTAVLCLAVAVHYAIPEKNFNSDLKRLTYSESEVDLNAMDEFYDALYEGRIADVEGVYVKSQWSLEVEENLLQVVSRDSEGIPSTIVAERKETNDGVIEVTHYTTKRVVEGFDFTEQIQPYEMELADGVLKILPPEEYRMRIVAFQTDFEISQFQEGDGRELFDDMDFPSYGFGEEVIYMKIPQHLQVETAPGVYLDILGEEE
ncbi:hypothetical protein SAMN05421736_107136 [Evansella caseinilytica]|uniref:Uncharacterized protein n=1 Tax=Evansella caseinilytica TaxID=1503961 RepID=A0A1H3R0N7_9BACI|nr:hypothetical protein [Evansella caseinilytica]SDZ19170.1 hypothetical protein SAMN05421736_107136 [Evansella caseinilytica]